MPAIPGRRDISTELLGGCGDIEQYRGACRFVERRVLVEWRVGLDQQRPAGPAHLDRLVDDIDRGAQGTCR
ncbi:hypothetical protein [Marinobacterium aestuariivivens]|uniref:Uncharacterized protein n=1 Tax=Marinobacterium aestuariivivens TaxID=1698799 RepID=A0ABW1ZYM2_9GAMM